MGDATKRIKFLVTSDESNALSGMDKVEKKALDLQSALGKVGLAFGAMEVGKFLFDAAKSSATLEVLRNNFVGTAEDIENFRKATAGTVAEAGLIKLSNQATDLGVTLKDQVILFAGAESAADKYGGSLEENFNKIVLASEGATKGLKSLGIQKEVYDSILKKLAENQGDVIDNLDAETQKVIRLQAIIQSLNITYDEALNNVADNADKIESWGVLWENVTNSIGTVALPVLFGLGDAIEKIYNGLVTIGNLPKNILSTIGIDISDTAILGGGKVDSSGTGSMEELAKKVRAEFEKNNPPKIIIGAVEKVRKEIKALTLANQDVNIGWERYYSNLKKIKDLSEKLNLPTAVFKISKDLLKASSELQGKGLTDVRSLDSLRPKDKLLREIGLTSKPNISDVLDFSQGEQDLINFVDTLTFSLTDTLRSGFDQAWEDIFGKANSLFEEFLSNIARGLFDLGTQKASAGIFDFILGLIPGGSALSAVTNAGGIGVGPSGKFESGGTTIIKIGDETVLKLVGNVFPQAYNNNVRYRMGVA